MDQTIFFNGWDGILRVVLVGAMAYAALVFMLRASGKRTLSKMNAFDLVVTVALGSTLATVMLSKDVPLADGVAALALLIAMQFAITWASVRSETVRGFVKSEPTILVQDGRVLETVMQAERITRAELDAALRAHGVRELGETQRVVLETEGEISVITAK